MIASWVQSQENNVFKGLDKVKVIKMSDNRYSLEELMVVMKKFRQESINTSVPIIFDYGEISKPQPTEPKLSKDALDAMAYALKALAKEGREKYGEGAGNLPSRSKTEDS
jgi:hypothetical protein